MYNAIRRISMKELLDLQKMYQEFTEQNYISQTNLNLIQKQRISVYRSIKPGAKISHEGVLTECDSYMAYLSKVLTNVKLASADYPYTLVIASTMHNPVMKHLSEEEQLKLVESEIGMLTATLKYFKQTPMQYGRKIKDVKHAIGELHQLHKELENPVK